MKVETWLVHDILDFSMQGVKPLRNSMELIDVMVKQPNMGGYQETMTELEYHVYETEDNRFLSYGQTTFEGHFYQFNKAHFEENDIKSSPN